MPSPSPGPRQPEPTTALAVLLLGTGPLRCRRNGGCQELLVRSFRPPVHATVLTAKVISRQSDLRWSSHGKDGKVTSCRVSSGDGRKAIVRINGQSKVIQSVRTAIGLSIARRPEMPTRNMLEQRFYDHENNKQKTNEAGNRAGSDAGVRRGNGAGRRHHR